jgi:hypothetical protein
MIFSVPQFAEFGNREDTVVHANYIDRNQIWNRWQAAVSAHGPASCLEWR